MLPSDVVRDTPAEMPHPEATAAQRADTPRVVFTLPPGIAGLYWEASTRAVAVYMRDRSGDVVCLARWSADEARAMIEALGRCVEESTRVVLDVDAT